MRMRKLALSLMILGAAGAVQAEELTGTLKKINDNDIIIVGHRESSVPFSYYDNQQKVVGYSQDYSNLIVEAVKEKLGKPNLQVRLIPITSQNRIPLLQNGTFDFECGSTTNNLANNKLISRILFLLLVHVYLRKKTVELKILLILRAKMWLLRQAPHLKCYSTSSMMRKK